MGDAVVTRTNDRVGSKQTFRADVRVIAATNQNQEQRVAASLLRQDWYYRINVLPLSLPPLCDRQRDIPLLADHFMEKYAKKMGEDMRRISDSAMHRMFAYHWPGNVRGLENCMEYAVLPSTMR